MVGGNVKICIIKVVKICIYYRVGRKTSDFGPGLAKATNLENMKT